MFICHEFTGILYGAAFFPKKIGESSPAPVRDGIAKPEGEYLGFSYLINNHKETLVSNNVLQLIV